MTEILLIRNLKLILMLMLVQDGLTVLWTTLPWSLQAVKTGG